MAQAWAMHETPQQHACTFDWRVALSEELYTSSLGPNQDLSPNRSKAGPSPTYLAHTQILGKAEPLNLVLGT
jgi:hypothetical protein